MKSLTITLAGWLVISSTGCGLTPRDVWVYIDNAGNRPMVVKVDDKEAATIAPGQFAKLSYPPGEHRFHITSSDEVLCDLTKNLAQSDKFGACRKYLFNPDKNNRYQIYQAKYGVNRLEGVMQTSLLSYQKDPQIKRQYIYKQLLKEVKLLPSDAWNDVTSVDYVLSPPPDHVYTKGTARRTVLWKIDQGNYQSLERLARIDKPTDEDIDALDDLLNNILADAP
jgi:hypothetical protein